MADRFWVGGGSSASWVATGPTNWSATSGGSNDASLPTSADPAIFDANSGTGNITLAAGWACGGLSISSLSGAMAFVSSGAGTISGGIQLPATNFSWGATGGITLAGSTGGNINTNGVTINGAITVAGAGGTWTLQSALTLATSRNITVTDGTLVTAGYAVTCQLFTGTGTSTRGITLGASVITVGGSGNAWNLANVTNLSFSGASAQIICSRSTGAQSFQGGGLSYGRLTKDGGSTLTIVGSNTFGTLDNVSGSGPIVFTAGTTQTITTWGLAGTSGTLLSLSSSGTWTIYKASGTVVADYVSLTNSFADTSGGTTYSATNSTDNGGNTNWSFGAATKQIAGTGGGSATGSGSITVIQQVAGTGSGAAGPGTGAITGGAGGPATKQIAGSGGGSAPDGAVVITLRRPIGGTGGGTSGGSGDITGGVVGVTEGGYFNLTRRRRRA